MPNTMNSNEHAIAIIGMGCRYPGANNIQDFWSILKNGTETIKHFTDEELRTAGITNSLLSHPHYVKSRGILNDINTFNAAQFKFSAEDALLLSHESKIYLQTVWQALEDAKIPTSNPPERTSVFVAMNINTNQNAIPFNSPYISSTQIANAVYGGPGHVATLTAYKFGFNGTAMNLYTACSTGLVAIISACQDLWLGNSDMSLAGGVYLDVPQECGYIYEEEGLLSADGHCRAFDADASGTVISNGAGVVVLKRLQDAITGGDSIRAIIKGYGINNDGNLKTGFFAPGIKGQVECIKQAFSHANVSPDMIDYIEAHGAATVVGDPIEFLALRRVFQGVGGSNHCGVGSVKTNIGHTTVVSGIAGLMKVALMLENRALVPSLNFASPNPNLNIDDSPFFITDEYRAFPPSKEKIFAGVSNFGIGGTNTHVVLQNYTKTPI